MTSVRRWLAGWFFLLGLLPTAQAQESHTKADLLLDTVAAAPGSTIHAAVRLRMSDGWHTYWRNPGDAGMATRIDWTLPKGITAGEIQWPAPSRLEEKDIITFGYSGEAVLIVPLRIAADAPHGDVEVKAKAKWLACREECVPGQAMLSAALTIGGQSKPSPSAAMVVEARSRIPPTGDERLSASWEGSAAGESRTLVIRSDSDGKFDLFPLDSKGFQVSAKSESLATKDGKAAIRKTVTKDEGEWPRGIAALLVPGGTDTSKAKVIQIAIAEAPASASGSPRVTEAIPLTLISLLLKMLAAMVGGVLLNIMPCVLPVLALKVLGFVSQAKQSPGRVRQLGLFYGAGVLASFLVLALVAIGIQKAGGLANWNTPFQSPTFRMALTVLIMLVALNLFGVFEVTLHSKANDTAAMFTSKEGGLGAFFNGVLAAMLATPCTAPFLASAVAFAFTQPPYVIVLIFLAVGLGLAAPFVILCWNPVWLKLMPRPGHWMVQFKMIMGFPMLATAVWLFWLTASRMGENGVLWFGLFLVVVAFAFWIYGEFGQGYTPRPGLAAAIAASLIVLSYYGIMERQLDWRTPASAKRKGLDWKPWSHEAVTAARKSGKPVLVDFTALGCLNCQLNKKTSIEIPSTQKQIQETGTVTLLGDYTDLDPAISEELRKFGRSGVPMVLVYSRDPAKEPRLLPVILTPGIVREALEWASQ